MKTLTIKLIITASSFLIFKKSFGQSNTLPSSGNVGIGTTTPERLLHVNVNEDSKPAGIPAPSLTGIKLSRNGTHNYSYSEAAELRIGHGGPYVWGSKLDLYINGPANQSNIPDQQAMTWLYNGNVGIGTESPNAKLEINSTPGVTTLKAFGSNGYMLIDNVGSGESYYQANLAHRFQGQSHKEVFTILGNGNIGIGASNPLTGLQLGDLNANIESKQIVIPGTYNFERLKLGHMGNGAMALEMVNHSNAALSYGMRLMTNLDTGGQGLQFQYASSKDSYDQLQYETALFMSSNGQIGIGTLTPKEKLSVNGKIRAHEIKVETNHWPDYVFEKGYKLSTLQETQQYIKDNGHLPGIPSAEEVKTNGIDLGQMNEKLLKKIEEITLHLIEMQKQNDAMQREIKILKKNKR